MDFPPPRRKINISICDHARKGLVDPNHFEREISLHAAFSLHALNKFFGPAQVFLAVGTCGRLPRATRPGPRLRTSYSTLRPTISAGAIGVPGAGATAAMSAPRSERRR